MMRMPMMPAMVPPVLKEMSFGGEVGEVVRGGDDVGCDVGGDGGDGEGEEGEQDEEGGVELAEQFDGIPDGLAEDDDAGGGDGDADEGVEGHGGREGPNGLADDLVALALGEASEVGDVEGEGGPESDHAGERGEEDLPEVGARLELAGLGGAWGPSRWPSCRPRRGGRGR